ncbi:MAG TPA: tetratricopeptide repeat protein [Terracidiphilus sp.]|nr:tetratricopeptide repeat protein [Terracidiphilus sp.]
MKIARKLRNRILTAALFAVVLASAPVRAHAVSKEIIQLQTQVQQLLDMVQRLQSTLDMRFGVLQNLAQQTADQTKLMGATVNDMQQKLNIQNEALSGKVDAVSGQVQSLNDSVDELKTRIAKLDKAIQDMQTQLQNIQTPPQPAATPGGAPAGPDALPGASPAAAGPMSAAPPVNQAPPLQQTYQSGLRDYNAGRYTLAAGEFQDVLHYYPLDDLAGAAQFYLGEIAYQQKQYSEAVNAYSLVLEGFSGNAKAPTAQLHKGLALLKLDKRDAGIHELRLLIQRYPRTPEASSARSKLNGMGVRINAR